MPTDQFEYRKRRLWVEPRGWLIEKEQVGLMQDRPGQSEARFHTRRVPADLVVE